MRHEIVGLFTNAGIPNRYAVLTLYERCMSAGAVCAQYGQCASCAIAVGIIVRHSVFVSFTISSLEEASRMDRSLFADCPTTL